MIDKKIISSLRSDQINMHQLCIAYLGGVKRDGLKKLLEISQKTGEPITYVQRRAVESHMNDAILEKLIDYSNNDGCDMILKSYENGMDDTNLEKLFISSPYDFGSAMKRMHIVAYEDGMDQRNLDNLYSLGIFTFQEVYYIIYKHGADQDILDNFLYEISVGSGSDAILKYIQKYKKEINLEEIYSFLTKDDDYDRKIELVNTMAMSGITEDKARIMAKLDNYEKMHLFGFMESILRISEKNLKLLSNLSYSDMEFCRIALESNLNDEEFELFVKIEDKAKLCTSGMIGSNNLIGCKQIMDRNSFKELLSLNNIDDMISFCNEYENKISSQELKNLVLKELE